MKFKFMKEILKPWIKSSEPFKARSPKKLFCNFISCFDDFSIQQTSLTITTFKPSSDLSSIKRRKITEDSFDFLANPFTSKLNSDLSPSLVRVERTIFLKAIMCRRPCPPWGKENESRQERKKLRHGNDHRQQSHGTVFLAFEFFERRRSPTSSGEGEKLKSESISHQHTSSAALSSDRQRLPSPPRSFARVGSWSSASLNSCWGKFQLGLQP